MKIDINNPKQVLSHFLLENIEVVDKVVETDEWQGDATLEATVFVNGVEINAESFEKTLQEMFEQVERQLRSKYNADDFDKKVDKKAKELLKDHADNAIDKMQDLINTLDQYEDIIKPHWER